MRILITGPQGAGKTTQANAICHKLYICCFFMGDIVRQVAQEDTPDGHLIRQAMETGELADNEVIARLMKETISREDCPNGYVIDGYPRTLDQIQFFDPHFDLVIDLQLSEQECIDRLLHRHRPDDTPELIRKRLGWYHQETEPVLEYYRNQGKLVDIDAHGTIDEVTERVLKAIEEYGTNTHP